MFMRRALDLGWQAAGLVAPRPPVGAVVEHNGTLLGEGYTQPRPGPHAEIIALNQAGERAKNATLYCTLEPHSFHGSAPPCATAIVEAGIRRVVVPLLDPNPQVNGSGLEILQQHGVKVSMHSNASEVAEAHELIEGFAKYCTAKMPFVWVKVAMSLDGKVATRLGDSKWITGRSARRRVHEMRSRADAVLTTSQTVIADDAQLTARNSTRGCSSPLFRILVDTRARVSPNASLFKDGSQILWFTGQDYHLEVIPSRAMHIQTSALANNLANRLNVKEILSKLAELNIITVLVEAGPTMLGALIDNGLVDRLDVFVAPVIIGGRNAFGAIAGDGIDSVVSALNCRISRIEQVGRDTLFVAYPKSNQKG